MTDLRSRCLGSFWKTDLDFWDNLKTDQDFWDNV